MKLSESLGDILIKRSNVCLIFTTAMLIIRISTKIERFTRILRNNNSHSTLKKISLLFFIMFFTEARSIYKNK